MIELNAAQLIFTPLPELPKGYFWRITEIPLFHQPLIQIRKKVWFWSEEVMEYRVDEPSEHTWEEATVITARHLLKKFYASNRYAVFMGKVQGDYPPKSTRDW